jgi:hexosaminidase
MPFLFSTVATLTILAVPPSATPVHNLMPVPASLVFGEGRFPLDSGFGATIMRFRDPRLEAAVSRAVMRLGRRIGVPVGRPGGAGLVVDVASAGQPVQTPEEDESYSLVVTEAGARLKANTVVGAMRGLETLLQLVSADSAGFYLPAVAIADAPRFRWRGLLIDVCRHWQPIEVIKRTLDGMAAVKLNVLHWHLSEDQGFRVESKRYPRLQGLGSDGLYYTQAQIREVVGYARDRGIRVVPEFDMPGHTTAWFVGYPQYASAPGPYVIERNFGVFDPVFDPTRDAVYQFIAGFIAEMAPLFPDPYWHIGGDEVTGRQWNANIRIQSYMRAHGLRSNEALQAQFNRRLIPILERNHKRMIGWDEVLQPDLPRSVVVQSWRGIEYLGQAAKAGYTGILSKPYYLDHISTAEEHYLADPLPDELGLSPEEAARVIGGEACMWGEHISPETIDSRIWPRLAAVAERLWSPASVRDIDDMYRRLSVTSIELESLGLGHETHTAHMVHEIAGERAVQPVYDLLQYVEPVSFAQRFRLQGTTQLTPLTRLIDAARPDPWARHRLNVLAAQAVADPAGQAVDSLKKVFTGWQELPERYAAMADFPTLHDGDPAVAMLARLGGLGNQALAYLPKNDAPGAWRDSARTLLDLAEQPQGTLRVVGTEAVRRLIQVKE